MFRRVIFLASCLCFLTGAAFGADLYRVYVGGADQAELLTAAGVEPVIMIQTGYLVLADPAVARELAGAGIRFEPLAADVEKGRLAVDYRLDDANAGKYPVVYEGGGLRVFLMTSDSWAERPDMRFLMPVRNEGMRIHYRPVRAARPAVVPEKADLQGLIELVSQDSLESYTGRLQAFMGRLTGSDSNYASRDWIAAEFDAFGYDSIVIDSFVENIYGTPTQCQNVIAYKVGTVLPDHHVIVGAHRDAVSGSPGADDNGSGTAGVLEIARVMKDIETDLTFVFILFDAEEQGLLGAYHYVQEASAREDSIVYMLNMDMIAHYENDDFAKLYHGTQLTYSELWRDLADSLVGITGILSGNSGGSDHYPFTQYGYEATFTFEYVFSTVYHSPHDSTTYMNFDYMTRMVKASLATTYTVSESYIPGPSLAFTYSGGPPSSIVPGVATAIDVTVSGYNDGVPVPGTGQLHYKVNDGSVITTDMTEVSANHYQAFLPAVYCGDWIDYNLTAEEATVGIITDPAPGVYRHAVPATGDTVVFADDFETDRGWTISGGLWARGMPTGGGGAYGGPDPVGGYKSPNCYGYNLDGDYTNNMPERHLTSPPIDCSDLTMVKFSYWRWLGVERPLYDHAYIRISTDGATWTNVWQNQAEIADEAWHNFEFDISAVADGQPTVYLRWTMGTTDGGWTYCGWNIDDVVVSGHVCEEGPGPVEILTPALPDWTAGQAYSIQLTVTGGIAPYTWVDVYDDLSGSGLALAADGLVSGVPSSPGTISFTARVTDSQSNSDERGFDFIINPPVTVVTASLPGGVVGQAYEQQLTCSGGTGTIVWTDRNNDLDGTGLSLSATGGLSGTPSAAGMIGFVARAEDAAGSFDEAALTVNVVPPHICGDANGDGEINVGDAVFIINYVFRNGPPPDPVCAGDANGDGDVNVGDTVYIVNYVFLNGAPPIDPCCF